MRIELPGLKQPVGLGDAVKAVTSAVGISTCGKCEERRRRLNKALAFYPPAPPPTSTQTVREYVIQIRK